jgi:hypothetical protein
MAIWGRLRSVAGGPTIRSLAGAATLYLPDESNVFLVTGSVTVTALTSGNWYGRRVTLIGGSSAAVTFTNTNSPSSDQMFLQGANILLNEQDVLVLIRQNDGSWFLESTTAS